MNNLIDVNASLGNWPFRRLQDNTPDRLLARMDANGIRQAWVASFDGVLNREPKTANLDLVSSVQAHRDRLMPFAVVNPNFPTWERDVALYLDELGMAGVRSYPNYHGYGLDAACFRELLACAGERRVPIQVAVRVADERMHHPLVKTPAVRLAGLSQQLQDPPAAAVILLNLQQSELAAAAEITKAHERVFVEISHVEIMGGVGLLLDRLPEGQVLFGTHAPLLYPESAVLKLHEADLTDEQRQRIGSGNALGSVLCIGSCCGSTKT